MYTLEQINTYINSQPEAKRTDMQRIHDLLLQASPGCKLWFFDGKNAEGKIVSNPNIGYGSCFINYVDGSNREFYQVGLSANTGGISVYVMGLDDKTHLARAYGEKIGKARVSGYCIKFKSLKDIHIDVLESAVRLGLEKQ